MLLHTYLSQTHTQQKVSNHSDKSLVDSLQLIHQQPTASAFSVKWGSRRGNYGEMAEWLNVPPWKGGIGVT